jgi:hypothetical protein
MHHSPEIRPSVACGGFAAEFLLLRNCHLLQMEEKVFTQIIFRNATKDREMFCGRTLSESEEFTREEDEAFMNHATSLVAQILIRYFSKMKQVVDELLLARKLDGKRIREVLLLPQS